MANSPKWGDVIERVLSGQPKAMCELILDRSDIYHALPATPTYTAPQYNPGINPLQILGVMALITFLLNSVLNLISNLGVINTNVIRVREIKTGLENEDFAAMENFVASAIDNKHTSEN